MARPWPRVVFLSLLPKRAVSMCHYHHRGQTHDNLRHSVDIRSVQAHMVALRHAIRPASRVCGLQRLGGPNTPWQQTCLYIGRPLSSHFAFFFTLSIIVNLNILYLHVLHAAQRESRSMECVRDSASGVRLSRSTPLLGERGNLMIESTFSSSR